MHVNIQGLRSHLAELCAIIRLSSTPIDIVCVNETFLDDGVEHIELEGFKAVGRRDRSYNGDDRRCGGIIVFARSEIADHVTLLLISEVAERMWIQLHTNNGPYVLCVWYRPPGQGEVQSIESFVAELDQLRDGALGVLVVGDLNVHSKRRLIHSNGNSTEGELMREHCLRQNLRQMMRRPTRGDYLLDLVITDIDSVSVSICPKIADHAVLLVRQNLSPPECFSHSRKVWSFSKADWEGLKHDLAAADWSF
jgi:exonuclease III